MLNALRCRDLLLPGSVGLAVALAVAGCSGRLPRDTSGYPASMTAVATEAGGFRSSTGCRVETLLYRPGQIRTDAVVVVAHGFLRDQRQMEGLARALAADGIPTVTLSFCNSRLWDGRHFQNGLDMRQLADQMEARKVVYAGFSAGGLAAMVAAAGDPRTAGVLALDLVDDRGLGERMASRLEVPVIGLVGDPAQCNSGNSGLVVYAANAQAELKAIPGASHCEFEDPTDWVCGFLCAHPHTGARGRRRLIIETSVAAVDRLLGLPVVVPP